VPCACSHAEGIPGQTAENTKVQPVVSIQVGQASSPVQYPAAYIAENFNEPKYGRHAFQRFCITYPRRNGVPEDLIHFWAGHAGKSATDDYSKLKDDLGFREEAAMRVRLGFQLPSKKIEVGPNGPKIETKRVYEMAGYV
jgi:hypothetical protein